MTLGIVDIGSNAVRVTVYDNDKISSSQIFNSKFKNDVKTILDSGEFEGKYQIYLVIQYIQHIFSQFKVDRYKCVATALFRSHKNGEKFIKYIEEQYGLEIEIISGEEEGRLCGNAVIMSINDANGVVVDLGGGSLELIGISNNKIDFIHSIELPSKLIENTESIITYYLNQIDKSKYENIYFTGGSLRVLAKIYIRVERYMLLNLHRNIINPKKFIHFAERVSSKIIKTGKLSNKKINQNVFTVAKTIIDFLKPKNIIISTFGLKEGIKWHILSEEEKKKNLTEELVKNFCKLDETKINYQSYFDLLEKIILPYSDIKNYIKIIELASIFINSFNKYIDKYVKYNNLEDQILLSDINFTPRERIMLAIIIAKFKTGRVNFKLINLSKQYLSAEEFKNIQIISMFFSVVELVDGILPENISFDIKVNQGYFTIQTNNILPSSIFKSVCSIIKNIALMHRGERTDKIYKEEE